jgi:hypothetical protein
MFAYEDVLLNERLMTLSRPDCLPNVEKIDDYTVGFRLPMGCDLTAFLDGDGAMLARLPKHYLIQFHAAYSSTADALARELGFSDWSGLFWHRADHRVIDGSFARTWDNPRLPVLEAWVITRPVDEANDGFVIERNPYYWKVDPFCNQLPYQDTIIFMGPAVPVIAAEWRDVPASELGNPPPGDIGARFRATYEYADDNGFVGGFPNFHQEDRGGGVVYGTILLNQVVADWDGEVPASELGNPPPGDIGARFRATHDYATDHGFVGGFPNFHQDDFGEGMVYGTILLYQGAAEWRDVPASELGNPPPDDIGARFRATYDYAIENGFIAGFPNFYQTDHGNGVVYGTILIRRAATE